MDSSDWLRVAQEHFNSGRLQDAERATLESLREEPNNPDALLQLAKLASRGGDLNSALDLIRRAQAIKPNSAEMLAAMGTVLFQLERLPEAQATYEAAIRLSPMEFMSHHNLGVIHQRSGNFPASANHFARAVQLNPNHALSHLNLGAVLRDLGHFNESTAQFQAAATLDPAMGHAFMQQAWNALLVGDYAKGWPLFEWRWRCGGPARPQFQQPVWDGSPLAGRSIMIHAEQGLGDTIQFSRYATLLAQSAREVILYVPETLRALMGTVPLLSHSISQQRLLPNFDVWCPMMSLPLLCGTTVPTIPAQVPYLSAQPADVESWRELLSREPVGYRVGICWAGNPKNYNDVNRSIPANLLRSIVRTPGVVTYSLQVGNQSSAAQALGMIDHTARLTNFSQTAALMMNLDLIISVDTACAHLAGALARKTWTLVPFAPEWRWMLDRKDSPWYPTMRIVRRAPGQSWQPVVDRVANDLRLLATQVAG